MQNRADIHHIKFLPHAAQMQHRRFQPYFQLVALGRIAHLLIVFNIVQYHQIGAKRTMAQAAQLFATASHLHLKIIGSNHRPRLPHAPLPAHIGKIHRQARVKFQLSLNRFQHRIGLVYAVHHQQDIVFTVGNNAPQRKKLRNQRRFRFTPRRSNAVLLVFRTV